ncbi:signal peptidase complex subunit 2-like [Watersipora subatra]|uniref:signal peptidase complex subunit 2-like n=1 Tax=Watersipora subatra TaxID=2589382 RepID=UPI00355C0690
MAGKKDKGEHKPAKVDKWDPTAVKNALDDATKKMMKDEFKCDEDHSLMNGRLGLSIVAVSFSGFAVLWDYLHPFPESRSVLIICASAYAILTAILTAYIMFMEKGIFYTGLEKDKAGIDPPSIWKFTSAQKKYDDVYELTVEYKDGVKGGDFIEAKLKSSVTKFVDENGTVREDIFMPRIKKLCEGLKVKKQN